MSNSKLAEKEGRKKIYKERGFSIDLRSRSAIKNASLDNRKHEGVMIEGTLGTLKSAGFLEGMILEVVGTDGVLRVDLMSEELLGNPRRAGVEDGEEANLN